MSAALLVDQVVVPTMSGTIGGSSARSFGATSGSDKANSSVLFRQFATVPQSNLQARLRCGFAACYNPTKRLNGCVNLSEFRQVWPDVLVLYRLDACRDDNV